MTKKEMQKIKISNSSKNSSTIDELWSKIHSHYVKGVNE